MIKLGIAPINWSNDDDPSLGFNTSFEQCIDEMSKAGYQGTELGSKFPQDSHTLKAVLRKRNLNLISGWFSTYFTEPDSSTKTCEDFLVHLSFLKALGAQYVNLCECGHSIQKGTQAILGPEKPIFTPRQWKALAQGLNTLGRMAEDFGLKTVYHYHAGTGVFYQDEIEYLLEITCPSLLGLLLDTGHAALAGIPLLPFITKHGQRIQYVHLKDLRQEVYHELKTKPLSFLEGVRAGIFTVPGDGCLDFKAILNELKAEGYQGWMLVEAEQDPSLAPPLEYALKAKEHLHSLMD